MMTDSDTPISRMTDRSLPETDHLDQVISPLVHDHSPSTPVAPIAGLNEIRPYYTFDPFAIGLVVLYLCLSVLLLSTFAWYRYYVRWKKKGWLGEGEETEEERDEGDVESVELASVGSSSSLGSSGDAESRKLPLLSSDDLNFANENENGITAGFPAIVEDDSESDESEHGKNGKKVKHHGKNIEHNSGYAQTAHLVGDEGGLLPGVGNNGNTTNRSGNANLNRSFDIARVQSHGTNGTQWNSIQGVGANKTAPTQRTSTTNITSSRPEGKILTQHGYSSHWSGTLLYYSWILMIAVLNLVLMFLIFSFFSLSPAWRWFVNGLLNLDFCFTEDLDETFVAGTGSGAGSGAGSGGVTGGSSSSSSSISGNELSSASGSGNQDPGDLEHLVHLEYTHLEHHLKIRYCSSTNGVTTKATAANSLGFAFMLIWIIGFGINVFYCLHRGKMKQFFLLPTPFLCCERVFVEQVDDDANALDIHDEGEPDGDEDLGNDLAKLGEDESLDGGDHGDESHGGGDETRDGGDGEGTNLQDGAARSPEKKSSKKKKEKSKKDKTSKKDKAKKDKSKNNTSTKSHKSSDKKKDPSDNKKKKEKKIDPTILIDLPVRSFQDEHGNIIRYFVFQCVRYVYCPYEDRFRMSENAFTDGSKQTLSDLISYKKLPITVSEQKIELDRNGLNLIDVEVRSLLKFVYEELHQLIYVWQWYAILGVIFWWYWHSGVFYKTFNKRDDPDHVVTSARSVRRSQLDVREMAKKESFVKVLRGNVEELYNENTSLLSTTARQTVTETATQTATQRPLQEHTERHSPLAYSNSQDSILRSDEVLLYEPKSYGFSKISSTRLVPGQIIQIEEGMSVPCDCVLLEGTVVMNESNLTGEALPVQKLAVCEQPIQDAGRTEDGSKEGSTHRGGNTDSSSVGPVNQSATGSRCSADRANRAEIESLGTLNEKLSTVTPSAPRGKKSVAISNRRSSFHRRTTNMSSIELGEFINSCDLEGNLEGSGSSDEDIQNINENGETIFNSENRFLSENADGDRRGFEHLDLDGVSDDLDRLEGSNDDLAGLNDDSDSLNDNFNGLVDLGYFDSDSDTDSDEDGAIWNVNEETLDRQKHGKKHFLYAGTSVLQSSGIGGRSGDSGSSGKIQNGNQRNGGHSNDIDDADSDCSDDDDDNNTDDTNSNFSENSSDLDAIVDAFGDVDRRTSQRENVNRRKRTFSYVFRSKLREVPEGAENFNSSETNNRSDHCEVDLSGSTDHAGEPPNNTAPTAFRGESAAALNIRAQKLNKLKKIKLSQNLPALALVISTGARTTKGQLIKNILFPSPIRFRFENQLFYAMILFSVLSLAWIIFGAIIFSVDTTGIQGIYSVLVQCFFNMVSMASAATSPLILVGFTKSQQFSVQRLKEGIYKIRSLAFRRTVMAGKVKVQCFDKTGTLTNEGLDFYGWLPVEGSSRKSSRSSTGKRACFGNEVLVGEYMASSSADGKINDCTDNGEKEKSSKRSNSNIFARLFRKCGRCFGKFVDCIGKFVRWICCLVKNRSSSSSSSSSSPAKSNNGRVVQNPSTVNANKFNANTPNKSFTFRVDETRLFDVALSTCHTVTKLRGSGELVGNAVECELVKFTNLHFRNNSKNGTVEYFRNNSKGRREDSHTPLFTTVRKFEFDQTIQLQSVVVEMERNRARLGEKENGHQNVQTKRHVLFSKGSFEQILRACDPRTIPVEYREVTKTLAAEGLYVLALAYRDVGQGINGTNNNHASLHEERDLLNQKPSAHRSGLPNNRFHWSTSPRFHLEQNLTFLGLIYFKNELKPTSRSAIQDLKQGNIKSVIVTGDSVWTGIKIAEECGIVEDNFVVMCGDVVNVKTRSGDGSGNRNVSFRGENCYSESSEPGSTKSLSIGNGDGTPTMQDKDVAHAGVPASKPSKFELKLDPRSSVGVGPVPWGNFSAGRNAAGIRGAPGAPAAMTGNVVTGQLSSVGDDQQGEEDDDAYNGSNANDTDDFEENFDFHQQLQWQYAREPAAQCGRDSMLQARESDIRKSVRTRSSERRSRSGSKRRGEKRGGRKSTHRRSQRKSVSQRRSQRRTQSNAKNLLEKEQTIAGNAREPASSGSLENLSSGSGISPTAMRARETCQIDFGGRQTCQNISEVELQTLNALRTVNSESGDENGTPEKPVIKQTDELLQTPGTTKSSKGGDTNGSHTSFESWSPGSPDFDSAGSADAGSPDSQSPGLYHARTYHSCFGTEDHLDDYVHSANANLDDSHLDDPHLDDYVHSANANLDATPDSNLLEIEQLGDIILKRSTKSNVRALSRTHSVLSGGRGSVAVGEVRSGRSTLSTLGRTTMRGDVGRTTPLGGGRTTTLAGRTTMLGGGAGGARGTLTLGAGGRSTLGGGRSTVRLGGRTRSTTVGSRSRFNSIVNGANAATTFSGANAATVNGSTVQFTGRLDPQNLNRVSSAPRLTTGVTFSPRVISSPLNHHLSGSHRTSEKSWRSAGSDDSGEENLRQKHHDKKLNPRSSARRTLSPAGTDAQELAQELTRQSVSQKSALPQDSESLPAPATKPKLYFALTQAAFEYLQVHDPKLLAQLFPRILVFGRMTSQGKVTVIKSWQDRGVVVGMCGDGGNDCGALRAAHVGLALSEGDASIAAPFSSPNNCPRAVVDLIKEGRCCLANCAACFKFIVVGALVLAFGKGLAMIKSIFISEYNIWFKDVLVAPILLHAVASSKPPATSYSEDVIDESEDSSGDRANGHGRNNNSKTTKEIAADPKIQKQTTPALKPHTPSANLVGWQHLTQVLALLLTNYVWILGFFKILETTDACLSWFGGLLDLDVVNVESADFFKRGAAVESQIKGLWIVFSFFQSAVIFSFGSDFRQGFYKNKSLVICVLVMTGYYLGIYTTHNTRLGCLHRVQCDNEHSWRYANDWTDAFLVGGSAGRDMVSMRPWFVERGVESTGGSGVEKSVEKSEDFAHGHYTLALRPERLPIEELAQDTFVESVFAEAEGNLPHESSNQIHSEGDSDPSKSSESSSLVANDENHSDPIVPPKLAPAFKECARQLIADPDTMVAPLPEKLRELIARTSSKQQEQLQKQLQGEVADVGMSSQQTSKDQNFAKAQGTKDLSWTKTWKTSFEVRRPAFADNCVIGVRFQEMLPTFGLPPGGMEETTQPSGNILSQIHHFEHNVEIKLNGATNQKSSSQSSISQKTSPHDVKENRIARRISQEISEELSKDISQDSENSEKVFSQEVSKGTSPPVVASLAAGLSAGLSVETATYWCNSLCESTWHEGNAMEADRFYCWYGAIRKKHITEADVVDDVGGSAVNGDNSNLDRESFKSDGHDHLGESGLASSGLPSSVVSDSQLRENLEVEGSDLESNISNVGDLGDDDDLEENENDDEDLKSNFSDSDSKNQISVASDSKIPVDDDSNSKISALSFDDSRGYVSDFKCYLIPRLDVEGEKALGPEWENFVRFKLNDGEEDELSDQEEAREDELNDQVSDEEGNHGTKKSPLRMPPGIESGRARSPMEFPESLVSRAVYYDGIEADENEDGKNKNSGAEENDEKPSAIDSSAIYSSAIENDDRTSSSLKLDRNFRVFVAMHQGILGHRPLDQDEGIFSPAVEEGDSNQESHGKSNESDESGWFARFLTQLVIPSRIFVFEVIGGLFALFACNCLIAFTLGKGREAVKKM